MGLTVIQLVNLQVVYRVNVNNKIEQETINNNPKSWNNVEVYMGDEEEDVENTIDVDYEYIILNKL